MFISQKQLNEIVNRITSDYKSHYLYSDIRQIQEKLDWLIEFLGLEFYEETTQKNATITYQKGFRKINKGRTN